MSASLARKLPEPQKGSKTRENVAPGEKSLYYKNVGLFSDPYLENLPKTRGDSFILQNWDTFDLPEFSECYEWMLSTWNELKDILPKLSEDQLRDKWIDPILQRLGWETQVEEKVQRWGKSQRPDYSLFESQSAWKKAQGCPQRDEGYFKHVTAIGEAKEMGVPLDTAKLNNTNPSFQIIAYLVATGKEWGILTDGRYWRLYSTKSKSSFRAYYEVNIEKFLVERDDDQFLYFYNFFRKLAFLKEADTNQSFLDVVFESGEHYAREVETKLKERAFELVELIAQGFSSENPPKSEQELRTVYEHSLYFLFRLLFVLNCEAKGLLSVHRNTDYYPYSLRSLCLRIKEEHEANQTWARVAKSYNHINDLFQLLATGDERIGLHGFGKEVFSSGDRTFYKNNPIPDSHLNKVLLALAFAEFGKKKELRFIDYKRLSADHLGSLFEGLLEYKLVSSNSGKSKDVMLVNSSGERKSSGSYYTPERIVDYIVKETLEPLTKNKEINDILELKVIDPAMGSGHFLLGAVRYLEQVILTKINENGGGQEFEHGVNWAVLHSCIYGIDKNPMAVELGKFSLWMYTAKNGYELEPLSDQLVCGDTLLDDLCSEHFKEIFSGKNGGFSAVIGNPPYVRIQGLADENGYHDKLKADYKTARFGSFDVYALFVEKSLKIVSKAGRVGFILPHKFLIADYGKPLRDLLKDGKHISQLVHFGDFQVFQGATTYTCVLILSKTPQDKFSLMKVSDLAQLDAPTESIYRVSDLGSDIWTLDSTDSKALLNVLSNNPRRLNHYTDKIFQGAITGADGIFVLKVIEEQKGAYKVLSKELPDEEFVVEKSVCYPILRGSDIARFDCPSFSSVVIFPYRCDSGVELLTANELRSSAPKAFAYLSKFKDRLSKRDKVKPDHWWSYSRPQNLPLFQEPKILSQVLSKLGKFTHDVKGDYFFLGGGTAGGNALKLNREAEGLEKVILAILNSSITAFYVSKVGSPFRGGFYAYGKASLENLPIPDLKRTGSIERKITELVERRENRRSRMRLDEVTHLEAEIEALVIELYGFDKRCRSVLEEFRSSHVNQADTTKRAA